MPAFTFSPLHCPAHTTHRWSNLMRTDKPDYKHYWNFSKRRKERLAEKNVQEFSLNLER